MIAAVIIFSVLFLAVCLVVLIIFLLDRASQQTAVWAEVGVARLVHWVVETVEATIASPVWAQTIPHRFRKQQLKENEEN